MSRPPPTCPDCSSATARLIAYGEPDTETWDKAKRGEIVLGGCVTTDNDPSWKCFDCGRLFGDHEQPYRKLTQRSREEWIALLTTMLPEPVQTNDAGELLAGDPVAVIVRIKENTIDVMEAAIEWQSHSARIQGRPFAEVPFRTAASHLAQLIAQARGKRVSRYRWCPRCERTVEPEYMAKALCQGCAEKVLKVVD